MNRMSVYYEIFLKLPISPQYNCFPVTYIFTNKKEMFAHKSNNLEEQTSNIGTEQTPNK